MKAIVVTDQAAGTAGMKLAERPEPPAAINDATQPSAAWLETASWSLEPTHVSSPTLEQHRLGDRRTSDDCRANWSGDDVRLPLAHLS